MRRLSSLKAMGLAGVAAAAAASVLAIAGCGGASESDAQATPLATTAPAHRAPLPAGSDPISSTSRHPTRAKGVEDGPDDEESLSGSKPLNPCILVTKGEASAILHKTVAKPVEAPQGPTCIYKVVHSGKQVTLAVQSRGFPKGGPVSQLHARMSVKVSGRKAYCGVIGSPMMIMPLSGKRFLIVGAPCPIAAGFAGKALTRLKP